MIYTVLNSKGGSGKSTLANQILPAFLFQKNKKKTRLIEIDDENEDAKILTETEILDVEILPTAKIETIDSIFISDEDVILDVGGNKTATIFLEEMAKLGEEGITWFIPLSQGLQDTANATDIYHTIQKVDKKAKIIFVLSNARSNDLEWEFLHFFGNPFLDTPFSIVDDPNIKDPEYIVVKNSDMVNNSKVFKKTIYDIAQNDTDFRAKAIEAKKNEDTFDMEKNLFLQRRRNEAALYVKDLNENLFPQLFSMLKIKK